jgi:hypothetical protein
VFGIASPHLAPASDWFLTAWAFFRVRIGCLQRLVLARLLIVFPMHVVPVRLYFILSEAFVIAGLGRAEVLHFKEMPSSVMTFEGAFVIVLKVTVLAIPVDLAGVESLFGSRGRLGLGLGWGLGLGVIPGSTGETLEALFNGTMFLAVWMPSVHSAHHLA